MLDLIGVFPHAVTFVAPLHKKTGQEESEPTEKVSFLDSSLSKARKKMC